MVSFTSIKYLQGGGEERERDLNLANVDRPVLKLILLLHRVNEGKQSPVFLLFPKDYSFYE